jgi:hypothetical protein
VVIHEMGSAYKQAVMKKGEYWGETVRDYSI